MNIKEFFLLYIIVSFFVYEKIDSELSIQQLEERKKADLKRAEERKKEVKKIFSKNNYNHSNYFFYIS